MFYGLTAFFYSTQVLPHWQKCDGSLIPEQYSAARSALGNHTPAYRDWETDRKSTRLNSSHRSLSRMPSSA